MNFGRINFTGDSGLAAQGGAFTGLETIGLIAGLMGTAVSAAGTIAGGSAQKANAEFEAEQLRRKGAEALGASQREAADEQRKTDLVLSRQQAGAAASGLGATDPTILQLQGDTFAQGRLNRDMHTYVGRSQQAGYLDQAAAGLASAKAAQKGSYLAAGGTILGGISSFGTKYANATRPVGARPAIQPDALSPDPDDYA